LVYSVALWRQKPGLILSFFWTSAFCGVASWQKSEEDEHGCAATNLPQYNGIKIVSVVQCIHGEIRRTNSLDIQKCEKKQTNKKLNVFGRPSGV